MKYLILLLILLTALAITSCTPSVSSESAQTQDKSCEHPPKAFHCVKFIKNYDGDTLTVDIPNMHPFFGKNVKVRVLGLDTPEVKTDNKCEKDAARIARRLVENLLKRAQRIDLTEIDRDKYFRVLANVIVDGRNLKDVLIKENLAYEYYGGKKEKIDWCKFREGRKEEPTL